MIGRSGARVGRWGLIDERDTRAAARRFACGSRAHHSRADDDDVEALHTRRILSHGLLLHDCGNLLRRAWDFTSGDGQEPLDDRFNKRRRAHRP